MPAYAGEGERRLEFALLLSEKVRMPKAGLEPARVSPYASETYVYTNFTTSAYSTVNESK
jgi:hypothetical protein